MKDKKIELEINGKGYSVVINEFTAYDAVLSVNGKKYNVNLKDLGIEQISDIKPQAAVYTESDSVARPSQPVKLHKPKSVSDVSSVIAPLPGLILKILVKPGDEVTGGQHVVTMEAMKMENEIRAKAAGVVNDIKVKEGDSIEEGAVIITLG